ncbi:nucleolar protein of 40 kDa-like [Vespa velutina]|uniref:nucleolar protein of 40 kDa-like n=1 Tax=Vespa velutina TaxID=202808 RepID=UPI001FB39CC7|nr:nucleolar protein of 40 kDa-like [Vespa velutina]
MVNCEVNQIFLGEIAAVQNYGAFVRIPGCSQQGLIHRSQVSSGHVDDVTEILQKGERVWCKVISVNDDGKIGLSMKHVNQGNGTDLDPNGVELQRDMQKKKAYVPQQRKTIQLEAVFNTTCTKCGTHGHLAKDCFVPPNGKKYELIPEVEDVSSIPKTQDEQEDKKIEKTEKAEKTEKTEKKHKTKKSKKRKKSKKSKQHTDDSSSDNEQTTKKSKKKRSKDHKQKKKKRNSSTSDTDSSDSSSQNIKSYKRKHSDRTEVRAKKCKHSKEKHTN